MKTEQRIDIDELMSRVRAEAERRDPVKHDGTVPLPAVRLLPRPPTIAWRRSVDSKKDRLEEMMRTAREKNDGAPGTPKMFRGLVRKQGSYNRILIDALGLLTGSNAQLNKQVRELTDSFDAQRRWLEMLADHRRIDVTWMQSAAHAISKVDDLAKDLEGVKHSLGQLNDLRKRNAEVERTAEVQREQIAHVGADLDAVRLDLYELRNHSQEAEKRFRQVTDELNTDRTRITTIQDELTRTVEAQEKLEQLVALNEERQESDSALRKEAGLKLEQLVSRNEERQANDSAFIKAQLSYYSQRLSKAKPIRKQGAVLGRAPTDALTDHSLDAFYLAFENRFRGTRQEVKGRLTTYLPFLREARITGVKGELVDLGCGRGEWLELLKEHHFEQGSGIDLNGSMVAQCHERGLEVTQADCVSALHLKADQACELVTAIHLIEHLPFSALMRLLAEIHRILIPGGITIMETPNPRNILVGASDFYRDLTHRNPIHPDTIAFALDSVGFKNTTVYFLEDEGERRLAIPESEFKFNDLSAYVEVPRDFAVIARKV